jgi:hypothetical protein
MTSFAVEVQQALASDVQVTDDELIVVLVDGRRIAAPIVWFPRLLNASPEARADWRLIGDGIGIHWPEVDEDISVNGLLKGLPSIEFYAQRKEGA